MMKYGSNRFVHFLSSAIDPLSVPPSIRFLTYFNIHVPYYICMYMLYDFCAITTTLIILYLPKTYGIGCYILLKRNNGMVHVHM